MLGIRSHKAFLACAASAVLAHSLVHSCSGIPTEEVAPLNHEGGQAHIPSVDASTPGELHEQLSRTPVLPEGKNPASQVASLAHGSPRFHPSQSGKAPADQVQEESSHEVAPSRRLHSPLSTSFREILDEIQYPPSDLKHRRLDGPLKTVVMQELLAENIFPHQAAPARRLQLLNGLSQLAQQPLNAMASIFGGGLSARDKDLLETFNRKVMTSRDRVYKDLVFATGAKLHGMDEYAMKQLVAKVGLENLATNHIPSNVQLSRTESLVLEGAKRAKFQVERIVSTYEREVQQHIKTLKQEMQADLSQQAIRNKIDSIVSDGLFRRHAFSFRRLQQLSRHRRLAAVGNLLHGPGLLGTAGSLLRSIDPSNLGNSLSTGLGGLGLHHLRLPNIGALGIRHDGSAPSPIPLLDVNSLQRALSSIFSVPQQAAALAGPLRSFQQGVSTATEGAIGAFLSREGLLPFLDVASAKQLLGGLIGGEAVAPQGVSSWNDLGLSSAAAEGLASVMSFDSFLSKLGGLAQEVDADVGTLKRETKKTIGAQGFTILPEQSLQIDNLLDSLVWGSLQSPARRRRLQQAVDAAETEMQATPAPTGQQKQQQQQKAHQTENTEEDDKDEASSTSSLFDVYLADEDFSDETEEEKMDAALQRIELLADAVTVLLREYEKAVEDLQKLLDEQIETAQDIRNELQQQTAKMQTQVKEATPQEQQKATTAAAAAAAEVAKAYDEAVEGLKESLEGLLQRQQQPLPAAVQQQVGSLAAKIEAAAEEHLPHPIAAH